MIIQSEKGKPRYSSERYLVTQSGLEFDGVDDYINLGNKPEYNFTDEFSISCFVKINGTGFQNSASNIYQALIIKGFRAIDSDDFAYGLGYNQITRELLFDLGDGNNYNTFSSNKILELQVWHHIVITYNTDTLSFYINGVNFKSFSNPTTLRATIQPLLINRRNGTLGQYSIGEVELAHLSLYNKALDQDEVHALHTWAGHIPESAQANCVEYQPLQYNDFVYGSVLKDKNSVLAPITVNQDLSTLSVGDIIYDNGGTWQEADDTNAVDEAYAPAILVSINGTTSFDYIRGSGIYILTGVTGLGNVGDKFYASSTGKTTVETGFLCYQIIEDDGVNTTIWVASNVAIWSIGARKQFNWKKGAANVLEESYGEVLGISPSELGLIEDARRNNSKAFYPYLDYRDRLFNIGGKYYNGIDQYDTIDTNPVAQSKGQPFTLMLDFTHYDNDPTLSHMIIGNAETKSAANKVWRIYYPITSGIYFSMAAAGNRRFTARARDLDDPDRTNLIEGERYILIVTFTGTAIPASTDPIDGFEMFLNNTKNVKVRIGSNTLALASNYINPLPVGLGKYTIEDAYTKTQIHRFEALNKQATTEEIADAMKYRTFLNTPTVLDTDYDLILDFGKNKNAISTLAPAPQYNLIDSGGLLEYREDKSSYPPITQGLRLQNINAGGDRNIWVELDKSNLPNENTDSYTWFFSYNDVKNIFDFSGLSDTKTTSLPFVFLKQLETDIYGRSINYFFSAQLLRSFFRFTFGDTIVSTDDVFDGSTPVGGDRNDNRLDDLQNNSLAVVFDKRVNKVTIYRNGIVYKTFDRSTFEDYSSAEVFSLSADPSKTSSSLLPQYYDYVISSFGYWKRALSNLEILHLHGNGSPNNPWINLPSDYNTPMQKDLVLWHQFQEGSIYEDTGVFKIKNWADDTGATDAILQESGNGTPLDLQGWRDRTYDII